MLRTLSAAVVAMSLIGGPVLAQGAANAPATTSQPAAKADVKVKKTEMKVTKTKKHVVKAVHHRKHVKHVKHVKHIKHGKHIKHPAKNKTAG